ncbi:MAG: hypothetical protein RQ949_01190 [Candidatus Calditenuis sp.]|nr:hypothetical protein [Candidatus Calditenuis sp.]
MDYERRFFRSLLTSVFLYLILVAGAFTPLSKQEAEERMRTLQEITGSINSPLQIFANNFLISLLMLVPFVGPPSAAYVIYNTGLFFSALSITTNVPPIVTVIAPLISIYGALEFIAYGFFFHHGLRFSYTVLKRRLKEELRPALFMVVIGTIVLLSAAFLEYLLIESLANFLPSSFR